MACVLSGLVPGTAFASDPGDLDTSFSTDGVKFIDFGGYDSAEQLFVDDAGRLTAVGSRRSSNNSGANAMARLLPDGGLDRDFANRGRRLFPLPSKMTPAWDWRETPEGKLIAFGPFRTTGYYMMRFDTAGRLDKTFGADGRVTGRFGDDGQLGDMLILPTGRIIVVGEVEGGTIIRAHRPDGSRDRSFGREGVVRARGDSFHVVYDPAGRFLLAGVRKNRRFVVDAFFPNGARDGSFGTNGRASIEIPNEGDELRSPIAAIATDGSIVLVSDLRAGLSSMDVVVARLKPTGEPDVGFGDGHGWRLFDIGAFDLRSAVAVLPGGKIVVGGYILQDFFGHDNNQLFLLALRADGSRWLPFGDDGVVRTDFGMERHVQAKEVLVVDGRLVVAGNAKSSFFVARFLMTKPSR